MPDAGQLAPYLQHKFNCRHVVCAECQMTRNHGHHQDDYNGDTSWHEFKSVGCTCGLDALLAASPSPEQSHGDQLRTLADAMRLTVQRPTLGLVNKVNKWAGILDTLASPAPSPVSQDEMPTHLRAYVDGWLKSNQQTPESVRYGRFPLGMVQRWIERAEAAENRPAPSPVSAPTRCVIGEYCRTHDFIHGGEAEELRSRVEAILAEVNHDGDDAADALDRALRIMLEEVDARDSAAFVSASPAPSPVSAWQPIETAPKDGTVVLGWMSEWAVAMPEAIIWLDGHRIERAGWHTYAGHHRFNKLPTHWMPLPLPPVPLSGERDR